MLSLLPSPFIRALPSSFSFHPSSPLRTPLLRSAVELCRGRGAFLTMCLGLYVNQIAWLGNSVSEALRHVPDVTLILHIWEERPRQGVIILFIRRKVYCVLCLAACTGNTVITWALMFCISDSFQVFFYIICLCSYFSALK